MDIRREARALADGCHIVVGTPGRLRDHLERGHLDVSQLKAVVLDEADEMLDLGFREDLEFILEATPPERRTLLFSATIPRDIASLARRFQRDALRIDTVDQSQPHGDIEYRAVRIAPNEIEHAVVNVLRFFDVRGAMVFCHTREAVRHLHASLLERGFAVVALSGELTQSERTHALQALRDGRARVCVATDVAARGIDLPDLGLVIHADLPSDRETLLHRSGRTGRAGRRGVCILLVPYTRRRRAEGLLAQAGVDASWGPPPSADEIRARDQDRLIRETASSEDVEEDDLATARALLEQRSAEEIAVALVRLYQAQMPAPEELFEADVQPRGERKMTREGRRADREDREKRSRERGAPRGPDESGVAWFRMSVGRRNNADPRWLLPIICRLGHVTKKDVGAIRIFERETKFGIAEHIAARFAAAVARAHDEEIRIEPAAPPGGGARVEARKNTGPQHRPGGDKGPGRNAPRPKPKRNRSKDGS
jgi:ATP-dependent RNA helicase DeaD